MQDYTTLIRNLILESGSEDAYGGWELWASAKNDAGISENLGDFKEQFLGVIDELIKDEYLVAINYHKGADDPYFEVDYSREKFSHEIDQALDVIKEGFYWFGATKKGMEEDQRVRRGE